MKAIYKPMGLPPMIIQVDNTLKALQRLVMGPIESITVATDGAILCNEEGKLRQLPFNITIMGLDLYGPVLLVGTKGDQFTDIPENCEEFLLRAMGGRS